MCLSLIYTKFHKLPFNFFLIFNVFRALSNINVGSFFVDIVNDF